MKKLVVASLLMAGIFSLNSCARKGSPSGGPKDIDPPVMVASFPDTMAVNVDPNFKEIRIDFNEYIQLKEYNKNVVISPPFEKAPVVTPLSMAAKELKIKLQEPLQPNTTYNINFGDAIQDYNEGNKLSNFSYVFSTGSYIDSLNVKGRISPGIDFELPKKTLVGLYKITEEYNDSVILKSKPYYISRADENGNFDLKYLSQGKYKIIAFEDVIENTKFDPAKEKVAFHNEIIDLKGNASVDLKLFKQKPNYRFSKAEQKGYGHIVFRTEGATQPVTVSILEREFQTAVIDAHPANDSINFWFNPKTEGFTNKSERISFEVKHGDKVDKATVLYSNPVKEYEFNFKTISNLKLAPTSPFEIAGSAPIASIDKSLINVFKDTVQIPFDVRINEKDKQIVEFLFEKNLGENFEINAYPNAFKDIFNTPNDTLVYQFKTGQREDFGNLKVRLQNLPEAPIFLQLIQKNQTYKVVQERTGTSREFEFPNLTPGEYYLRVLIDSNNNGAWDSGNVLDQIQPEPVYIYPDKILIRAMWDSDETWIIGKESEFTVPIEKEVKEEQDPTKK
ncbi:Ig-like domain-containing protein [Faecalibacter sp. LW9]|uniref:Ig-like domain-containing protein n=1 Tax=Faecalibacter sp. LW9 TaxID=3103144 RepID=UPI002B000DC3|nr:Ig-like domain-containing protein [Faecalibacter sp. LW9]